MDFDAALKHDEGDLVDAEFTEYPLVAQNLDPTPYKENFDKYAVEISNMRNQALVMIVDSDESARLAVEMATQAKGLIKKVDNEHSRITGPIQKFKSAIDSFRKFWKDQLLEIPASLEPKVTDWNKKKREEAERKAEEERKKAAELQRRLDQEAAEKNRIIKEKAEAEARAKAAEEARIRAEQAAKEAKERAERQAEQARIQAEKDKLSKAEVEKKAEEARKKAEEQAKIEAEKAAEQARIDAELAAKKAAEQAETVQAVHVAEVVPDVPKNIKTSSGSATAKLKWTFKLVDISQVPVEFLLLNEKKIKHLVEAGIRNIPGIEIFQQEKTSFRSK